ncbi:Protein Simiate [Gracilariopsis chorda]|uniref:Protein Abitram n=1 Tax=Gracilariopsis chorda TaxID=448386 RepID=A0A2V3IU38_9FLOR|nr:Protein Simiate [Gracilariopsis chorda]|eukprot:PXF45247.1 Protein Simiate [Gracilariopsis chorda]
MHRIVPPSTIERYFTLHYAPGLARQLSPRTKPPDRGEDLCIARHHNGICVLCLSPLHPIVTQRRAIQAVDYRVEMRQVKGKRKKGGIVVEEKTRLCTIICEAGERYAVQCGIKGTLLEYNDMLAKDTSLINQRPLTEGYLGVVLPWPSQIKTAVDALMSKTDYDNIVE